MSHQRFWAVQHCTAFPCLFHYHYNIIVHFLWATVCKIMLYICRCSSTFQGNKRECSKNNIPRDLYIGVIMIVIIIHAFLPQIQCWHYTIFSSVSFSWVHFFFEPLFVYISTMIMILKLLHKITQHGCLSPSTTYISNMAIIHLSSIAYLA